MCKRKGHFPEQEQDPVIQVLWVPFCGHTYSQRICCYAHLVSLPEILYLRTDRLVFNVVLNFLYYHILLDSCVGFE
jgi:hypothetical protein